MPDWLQVFWTWVQTLPSGAASFVGSLTGASIGLIAIVIGALFNAHLNRRRDDRLRKQDARASATALRAELSAINETLSRNIVHSQTSPPSSGQGYYVPDLSQAIRVFPHVLPKIGLFDVETIRPVLDAYAILEQYAESLVMGAGGQQHPAAPVNRRAIYVPGTHTSALTQLDRKTSDYIQAALAKLDGFLSKEQ